MVDGQIVVEQGQLLTIDEDELLEEVGPRARALYQRAGLAPQLSWPVR